MVLDPWSTEGFDYPHLRIPTHSQPDDAAYCVPYALWMIISYVKNEYTDNTIRSKTETIPTWELVKMIKPDEFTGWRPNQADLTKVSETTKTISFSLEQWPGDPPKSLMELAQESLEEDLPLIGFIDSFLLEYGVRSGRGADHCVIICGLGKDSNGNDTAVIADPWYAALHECPQDKLNEAWDPSHHQIIDVGVRQIAKSGV